MFNHLNDFRFQAKFSHSIDKCYSISLEINSPIAPGTPSNPRSPLSPLKPGLQSEQRPPTSPIQQ